MNADTGQFRKEWLELLPDPLGDDFAGRIFQTRYFVQIVMIELFVEWFEDRFDLGEVANPAGVGVDFAFNIDGNAERMAMQAPTFMPFGHMGKAVGSFENKLFEQFHGLSL